MVYVCVKNYIYGDLFYCLFDDLRSHSYPFAFLKFECFKVSVGHIMTGWHHVDSAYLQAQIQVNKSVHTLATAQELFN